MRVMFAVRLVLSILAIAPAFGASYYVREGATGSRNGSDWANAFTNLPASSSLQRGSTYYVADGNNYVASIQRPASDTSPVPIVIRKATQADHGTDVGWNPAYGDGVANWKPVMFAASYIVFDGAVGGGPSAYTTGHGFKIYDTNNVILVMLSSKYGAPSDRVNVTNVTIAHTEIASFNAPGNGEGINATAYQANYSGLVLSNLYVHDIGNGHAYIIHGRDFVIDGCWFGRNATSPTAHGCIIRMDYCHNWRVRNSWFEDGVGTGFMGAYDGTGTDIHIYGNVFCYSATGPSPSAGSSGYGNGVLYTLNNTSVGINPVNWRIYNNTFYNLPDGNSIHLFIQGSNNSARNNLFYKNKGSSWTVSGIPHEGNAFGLPTSFPTETAAITLSQDPFKNSAAFDLTPKSALLSSPALPDGWALDDGVNGEHRDAFGNVRGQNGVWTPGAYQYPAIAGVSSPLTLVDP